MTGVVTPPSARAAASGENRKDMSCSCRSDAPPTDAGSGEVNFRRAGIEPVSAVSRDGHAVAGVHDKSRAPPDRATEVERHALQFVPREGIRPEGSDRPGGWVSRARDKFVGARVAG